MILKKLDRATKEGITYVHDSVWFNSKINSEALRVYGALLSLPVGKVYPGKDICEPLGISMATFNRVKKILKDNDLLITECGKGGIWTTYVGDPEYPASKVKEEYEEVVV